MAQEQTQEAQGRSLNAVITPISCLNHGYPYCCLQCLKNLRAPFPNFNSQRNPAVEPALLRPKLPATSFALTMGDATGRGASPIARLLLTLHYPGFGDTAGEEARARSVGQEPMRLPSHCMAPAQSGGRVRGVWGGAPRWRRAERVTHLACRPLVCPKTEGRNVVETQFKSHKKKPSPLTVSAEQRDLANRIAAVEALDRVACPRCNAPYRGTLFPPYFVCICCRHRWSENPRVDALGNFLEQIHTHHPWQWFFTGTFARPVSASGAHYMFVRYMEGIQREMAQQQHGKPACGTDYSEADGQPSLLKFATYKPYAFRADEYGPIGGRFHLHARLATSPRYRCSAVSGSASGSGELIVAGFIAGLAGTRVYLLTIRPLAPAST